MIRLKRCLQMLGVLLYLLHAAVASTPTAVADEADAKVTYVTGCLGSNAVTLHEPMSSWDDIRAVFVYKGSEILGSDIIPAQGNYKGRLQIDRQGEILLSGLRLSDSGVFRVEMATREGKDSTYVVLVIPEAPATRNNKLQVKVAKPHDSRHLRRLTCGKFITFGYPPASVLWVDPLGRFLSSSGHRDGHFYLDITEDFPPGNYSCMLHCDTVDNCCLSQSSSSMLLRPATVYVETGMTHGHTPMTSEITPELEMTLQRTGEDMAVSMAALVNERVRGTLEDGRQQVEDWKREMGQEVERRMDESKKELQRMFEKNLEELSSAFKNASNRDVTLGGGLSRDVYFSQDTLPPRQTENSLRFLRRQIEEERKNFTDFQEQMTRQIVLFQKKLRTLRSNLKKYGVFHHRKTMQKLEDRIEERFKEIDDKLENWETADGDIANTLQLVIEELNGKMSESETSLSTFYKKVTDKVEALQQQVAAMERRIQHQEQRLLRRTQSNHHEGGRQTDGEVVNDTKSKIEMSEKGDRGNTVDRATHTGRHHASQQRRTNSPSRPTYLYNNTVSDNCGDAKRKGGHSSGAYRLQPDGLDPDLYWCDMDTDAGGWLVIQRRQDGSEEFYRPWKDYVDGFGNSASSGEFWLGLDKLHLLTADQPHSLRVDLRSFSGQDGHAQYQHFRVLGLHQNFLMTVYGFSGTAGDGLIVHDSQTFSTWDRDNDLWADGHCAENYRSAWWYAGCRVCDLNAPYTPGPDGIMWLYGDDTWGAGKVAFVEMKIRPV